MPMSSVDREKTKMLEEQVESLVDLKALFSKLLVAGSFSQGSCSKHRIVSSIELVQQFEVSFVSNHFPNDKDFVIGPLLHLCIRLT